MTSKDIQPFIIPKSYVIDRERERERLRESDTKKRGGVEITTVHCCTSKPSAIWNHFSCVILFATKWGLNFHGLYHIVLCCTRLQSEAARRGQSEREGIYIYLVCGLMAPYVCEKKWQAEVGSEQRPTTPLPAPTVQPTSPPPNTCLKPTSPPRMPGCPVSLGPFCPPQHTRMTVWRRLVLSYTPSLISLIQQPFFFFISLSDKRADGGPTVVSTND